MVEVVLRETRPYISVILGIIEKVGQVVLITKLEIIMKENGQTINLMDMVSFMIILEINILENGKMEINMVNSWMNT